MDRTRADPKSPWQTYHGVLDGRIQESEFASDCCLAFRFSAVPFYGTTKTVMPSVFVRAPPAMKNAGNFHGKTVGVLLPRYARCCCQLRCIAASRAFQLMRKVPSPVG